MDASLDTCDPRRLSNLLDTESVSPAAPLAEGPGARIGRYKLLQLIGEGGFGSVFMAEQETPVVRKVALKIIKLGMDTKQVIARFEAERQALAMMDHPNIAKVFDAGATETGRPYFVMELVKGIPITEFCNQHHLPARKRLELFVEVCKAIQHAHQKGVIHRDLKPSNVLVTLHDGTPVPKVIDFGIAKATNQRLTEHTLFTEFRLFIGTPHYMPPEQADISGLDVDTRADIYSLGVLLYELLTDTTPFDPKQLCGSAYAEIQRIIREVEPPRPSTRLSTMGAQLADVAARMGTDPKKLSQSVAGELDWIVMRCLEKDRSQRYETANALARDIQRYLSDEPVEASPPSATYRLRKLMRKHRRQAVAIFAIAGALLLGIIGTSIGLARAGHNLAAAHFAENQLRQEKDLANASAARAAAAELHAVDQRKQAEAVAGALESIFQRLDPYSERGGQADLRTQLVAELDNIAAVLNKEQAGEPLVRARLRDSLGWTLLRLGQIAKGQAQIESAAQDWQSAAGPDDAHHYRILYHLGVARSTAGRYLDAIKILEGVRDWQLKALGPNDPQTLTTLHDLAGAYNGSGRDIEAFHLVQQVRDRRAAALAPDDPDNLIARRELANQYRRTLRTPEAIKLLQQVYDEQVNTLTADHPEALRTQQSLAWAYVDSGRTAEGFELFGQIRDRQIRAFGPDNIDVLQTQRDIAQAYHEVGRITDAIKILEPLQETVSTKLGPDIPLTDDVTSVLASVYLDAGRAPDAVKMLEQVRDQKIRRLGPDDPSVLITLCHIAVAYSHVGRWRESIQLLESLRDKQAATLSPDRTEVLEMQRLLATAYADHGRASEAVDLLEHVRDRWERNLGPDYRMTLITMNDLAEAYGVAGRLNDAIALYEEIQKRVARSGVDVTFGFEGHFANMYRRLGRVSEAIQLLEPLVEKLTNQRGRDDDETADAMNDLAIAYQDADRPADAIKLLEPAFETVRRIYGPSHCDTATVAENLIRSYRSAGRTADAAKLFMEIAPHLVDIQTEYLKSNPSGAELFAERGRLYARMGRFTEAAADLRKAIDLHPQEEGYWHDYLPLLLQIGEVDTYRQWRDKELDRFADYQDYGVQNRVAKDYIMLDADGPGFNRMVAIADSSLAKNPTRVWTIGLKGIIEYDRGNFQTAIRWLLRAIPQVNDVGDNMMSVTNHFWLAMAYFRAGDASAARKTLADALAVEKQMPQPGQDDLTAVTFMDWIFCELSRRQAEKLIGTVEPSTTQPAAVEPPPLDEQEWAQIRELQRGAIAQKSIAIDRLKGVDRQNAFLDRAKMNMRIGEFDRAAEDIALLISSPPDNSENVLFIGSALAYAGKMPEYRDFCRLIYDRFSNSPNSWDLDRTTKVCLLLPNGIGGDLKKMTDVVQKVFDRAADADAWSSILKALADYRNGDWDGCIRHALKARAGRQYKGSIPTIDLLAAMAYFRLGHSEQAREQYRQAEDRINQEFPNPTGGGVGGADENWLIYQVLRREAQAMMDAPATRPAVN